MGFPPPSCCKWVIKKTVGFLSSLWLESYLVVWSTWISAGPVWNLLNLVPRDWQTTEHPGTFPLGDITEEIFLWCMCIYIYTYCVCMDMYIYIIRWEGIGHSIRERQVFLDFGADINMYWHVLLIYFIVVHGTIIILYYRFCRRRCCCCRRSCYYYYYSQFSYFTIIIFLVLHFKFNFVRAVWSCRWSLSRYLPQLSYYFSINFLLFSQFVVMFL